jgi:glycosyltransferase involved in cell wall biosynthesis
VRTATSETARAAGVTAEKITVIPNGVDPDAFYDPDAARDDLEQQLRLETGIDIDATDKTVLLSVGRLVERKGFHWFVDQVMPELDDRYIYIICGSGSYRETIQEKLIANDLADRVHLPGRVSNGLLRTCYNTADMLLMPNVPVDGDMEGFGLVAVEASSCGTPVIAADMEGMQDAVIDGTTGKRVPPQDRQAFQDTINDLAATSMEREAVRQATVEAFSWEQRADTYVDVFTAASD